MRTFARPRDMPVASGRRARSRVWTRLALSFAIVVPMVVSAASASASSIVFISGGNVWLANPDGSSQRQVTTGGFWDSPSQADDGTILAQRGTQLFRINRQGTQPAPAIDTSFTGAPATWAGPVGAVISPDGVDQAYGGEFSDSGSYDPGCNCEVFAHTFTTLWGSATRYSQPGQTLGQEDYVDPAWIDSSHLLLSSTGILIDQVATYTLGGGDNTMTQWFSDPDPSVGALGQGAVTRAGDKLAFIANVQGGLGNEIRIYAATGTPPVAGGPAASAPTDTCNIGPNSFQSIRVSFSPDGQSLAYDAPDGIHLVSVANLPSCSGLDDHLIIPGGSLPYFGPANVGPNDGIQSGGGGNGGGGSGGGGNGGGGSGGNTGPSSAFTISKRRIAGNHVITLILATKAAGRFRVRASAHKGPRHSTFSYGTGSVRVPRAGTVRLTIKPTETARLTLKHTKRLLVTVTIAFTPSGGRAATTHTSIAVTARHR
jgi:uncharacterized membrane protein YgcG